MFRTTQRALRSMVADGIAIDATHMPQDDVYELARESRTLIACSHGVYGCNGICFKSDETGQMFVVVGRCTNLFILN